MSTTRSHSAQCIELAKMAAAENWALDHGRYHTELAESDFVKVETELVEWAKLYLSNGTVECSCRN